MLLADLQTFEATEALSTSREKILDNFSKLNTEIVEHVLHKTVDGTAWKSDNMRITNTAEPVDDNDVATKVYVLRERDKASAHTHTVAQISDFPVLTTVSTVTFTGSDSRWGVLADAMYPLTIPLSGKTTAIDVVRSSDNKRVTCDIQISGTNVIVYASEKFSGYVHLI